MKATSTFIQEKVYQTKRYYRCENCSTVYVEVLEPMHLDNIHGADVIRVEKYPPIKEKEITLDKWMVKQ